MSNTETPLNKALEKVYWQISQTGIITDNQLAFLIMFKNTQGQNTNIIKSVCDNASSISKAIDTLLK